MRGLLVEGMLLPVVRGPGGPCSPIPCLPQQGADARPCCTLAVSPRDFHPAKWYCGPSSFPLPLLEVRLVPAPCQCAASLMLRGSIPKTLPYLR